jgi:hypothetical protein
MRGGLILDCLFEGPTGLVVRPHTDETQSIQLMQRPSR